MNTITLTHRDLAQQLGVSETTIKSYRTKFPTFLPVARAGKPIRLHQEALSVCLRIRTLFAEGLSVLQTSEALRAEFKEYPAHRRLSTPTKTADIKQISIDDAPHSQPQGIQDLEELVRQLHTAQLLSQRESQERIDRLEAELRNLATMEAASKALIADLVGELRAQRHMAAAQPFIPAEQPATAQAPAHERVQPVPHENAAPQGADQLDQTVLTARKIVTVHGRSGPVASYAFGREQKPEPPFRPANPPKDFLELPAVIRSERGEFLGLPGKQSIARMVQTLGGDAHTWLEDGPEGWICLIPLDRVRNRELHFERTQTPRGNLVGLIKQMRDGDEEAAPHELQELFRQLRDQLT